MRIGFRPYDDDSTSSSLRKVVSSSVVNTADSVRWSFLPDSSYAGVHGRFFVEATDSPGSIDSSAMVYFARSMVRIDSTAIAASITAQQTMLVRGVYHCVD